MTSRAERVLRAAVPRLARDDEGASKLRRALLRRARSTWAEGPGALAALGVDVAATPRLPKGDDELLDALHAALGDRGLATFARALRADLARAIAAKRDADAAPPAPADDPDARATRDAKSDSASDDGTSDEGATPARLTISSHDDVATTDDGDGGLAVPDEEDAGPLSIRFDEGAAASAAAPAKTAKASGAGDERDDDDATQAADRALSRYGATGDPDELSRARTLFARAAKAATTNPARGAARGGLALATLLGGDAEKAREHAEKALALFPDDPRAIEAWLRSGRPGEVDRARVRAALARAGRALEAEDAKAAAAVAGELDEVEGGGAFAGLVRLAVVPDRGDPEAAIKAAWAKYPPSVALADLTLGAALERGVIPRCLAWVRERVERDPGRTLAATVERPEDRSNVVAGAVQLALGVARAALATRHPLGKNEEQELRLWEGQALFFAQDDDQAAEVLAQARRVAREGPRALEAHRDEQQCGVMRRAFDKPGVKAKLGTLDGVGLKRRREALAARAQAIVVEQQKLGAGLDEAEAALVVALLPDAKRRGRLAARALAAGQDDPLSRVAEVEASLNELDAPDAAAAPAPDQPAAGGLFGRMKGGLTRAFDAAKAAAQKAEQAVRRSVLDGKRNEAQKALGRRLRQRPQGGWGDADLDAHVDRVEAIQPRLEALDEEAAALREAVGRG